jgi:Arc/MetJ family transcription regulator
MYLTIYFICMKTTLNIDEQLLNEAMKIVNARTKTEAVELGLKELVNRAKREKLARLFGKEPNVEQVPRRPGE